MKALYASILVFALCVSFASAENLYKEFDTGYPETDSILLYNFPVWAEVNETQTIYVSNVFAATNNYAEITLSGGNASNMTYIHSRNQFRSFVTSTTEEDVNFTIAIYNASGTLLANGSSTLKFRVPFTITFNFYKNTNTTSTKVEKYDNEFQYAVLRYYAPGERRVSYELRGDFFIKAIESVNSLLPYYTKRDPTTQIPIADETYLWARMVDGTAEITVFESGSYDLYIWNGEIYGGLTPMYEFGKPQNNGDTEIRTVIAGFLSVGTEADQAYGVYISAWEVYKWHVVKNILWIVIATIVWAGLGVLIAGGIASAAGNFLTDDMKGKAFGVILGTYAVGTSPIYVLALGLIV